jgi:phage-related holin
MEELTPAKVFAGLLASLLAVHQWTPVYIERTLTVASFFILIDLITGAWSAALSGRLTSSALRQKMAAKCVQYFCIVAVGSGVSILAGNWTFVYMAIFFVCGTEALSIIENAQTLEKNGVNLGPLSPFLSKIQQFFDLSSKLGKPDDNQNKAKQSKAKDGDKNDNQTELP